MVRHEFESDVLLCVAVDEQDGFLYASSQHFDGSHEFGVLQHFNCIGQPGERFLSPNRSNGPWRQLLLLNSPYRSNKCWLYALGFRQVTVFDAHTHECLFMLGGGQLVESADGFLHLSRNHSQRFLERTPVFLREDAQQPGHCSHNLQALPALKQAISTLPRLDIVNMACDTGRGELYLHEAQSRHWLVCDQRGGIKRSWYDDSSREASRGSLPSYRGCAVYDSARDRLVTIWHPADVVRVPNGGGQTDLAGITKAQLRVMV